MLKLRVVLSDQQFDQAWYVRPSISKGWDLYAKESKARNKIFQKCIPPYQLAKRDIGRRDQSYVQW
jgi:hypothetical protein